MTWGGLFGVWIPFSFNQLIGERGQAPAVTPSFWSTKAASWELAEAVPRGGALSLITSSKIDASFLAAKSREARGIRFKILTVGRLGLKVGGGDKNQEMGDALGVCKSPGSGRRLGRGHELARALSLLWNNGTQHTDYMENQCTLSTDHLRSS